MNVQLKKNLNEETNALNEKYGFHLENEHLGFGFRASEKFPDC